MTRPASASRWGSALRWSHWTATRHYVTPTPVRNTGRNAPGNAAVLRLAVFHSLFNVASRRDERVTPVIFGQARGNIRASFGHGLAKSETTRREGGRLTSRRQSSLGFGEKSGTIDTPRRRDTRRNGLEAYARARFPIIIGTVGLRQWTASSTRQSTGRMKRCKNRELSASHPSGDPA